MSDWWVESKKRRLENGSAAMRPCLCRNCKGKLRLSKDFGDRLCTQGRIALGEKIYDVIRLPPSEEDDEPVWRPLSASQKERYKSE